MGWPSWGYLGLVPEAKTLAFHRPEFQKTRVDKMQVSSLFLTPQKSPSPPASPNTKAPEWPTWAQEGGRVEARKCQNLVVIRVLKLSGETLH